MTLRDVIKAIFGTLGAVVTVGGGATTVAYLVFRWLGSRWLDQKFQEQLEQLKHEQQKELEKLHHEINSLFSRISKIHEREFEVLPKAWHLLHEAYGKAVRVTSAGVEIIDLNGMSQPQREELLDSCRLPEFKKAEVRNAKDLTKEYQEAISWVNLSEAMAAQLAFHNFLVENRIFMTDELRDKFSAVDNDLDDAIRQEHIGRQGQGIAQLQKSAADKVGQLSKKVSEVEIAVQKRLRYEEA